MTVFSFYDSYGDFVGGTFSGPGSSICSNTPAGCSAIVGVYDALRQRVVLADDGFGNVFPAVVARKPAKPFSSDWVTWEWDEVADEWVAHPTLAANRSALRAARNSELQATDGASIAALEALLQGVLAALGRPLPAAAQQLLDHRDALRAMPQRPDFDSLSVADVPRYLGSTNTGR
jgi:hypothetical protein